MAIIFSGIFSVLPPSLLSVTHVLGCLRSYSSLMLFIFLIYSFYLILESFYCYDFKFIYLSFCIVWSAINSICYFSFQTFPLEIICVGSELVSIDYLIIMGHAFLSLCMPYLRLDARLLPCWVLDIFVFLYIFLSFVLDCS